MFKRFRLRLGRSILEVIVKMCDYALANSSDQPPHEINEIIDARNGALRKLEIVVTKAKSC